MLAKCSSKDQWAFFKARIGHFCFHSLKSLKELQTPEQVWSTVTSQACINSRSWWPHRDVRVEKKRCGLISWLSCLIFRSGVRLVTVVLFTALCHGDTWSRLSFLARFLCFLWFSVLLSVASTSSIPTLLCVVGLWQRRCVHLAHFTYSHRSVTRRSERQLQAKSPQGAFIWNTKWGNASWKQHNDFSMN